MNDLHYAVVVGINRYPGLDSSLKFARSDANAFKRWLVDPHGGGLPHDNVASVVVTKAVEEGFKDADHAEPSQRDVVSALTKINAKSKKDIADDVEKWLQSRLYLYLSGHGIAPQGGKAALLTADASLDSMGFNIDLGLYADWYEACAIFHEIVFLGDCCRDIRRDATSSVPFNSCTNQKNPVVRMVSFATTLGDPAFEPTAGEGDPNLGRGYFTQALLAGLRGDAVNGDGRIDSTSLGNYLRQTVQNLTKDRVRTQDATMDSDPGQPIVFRAAPAAPTWQVTIDFPAGFTASVELLGPSLLVLQQWDASKGPLTATLERGFYGVRPVGAKDGAGVFAGGGLFMVAAEDVHVQL